MCTHARAVVVPVVVLALLLAAGPGATTIYHPLDVGTEWHYANELGQTHSRSMTGIQDVLGVETVVRHEEISESGAVIDLFANFWTCDGEGDLYLHGAVNYMYGFEAAYCPPIMIVDSPLEYDKVWVTQDVQRCDLDGSNCGDPFDAAYIVCIEEEVLVPAGAFHSYGIGDYPVPPRLQSLVGIQFDVFGRRLPTGGLGSRFFARDWYSEDVGVVQYQYYTEPERMMRLEYWQATAVEPATSWGRLKALYR
jgi:hypothetical protein